MRLRCLALFIALATPLLASAHPGHAAASASFLQGFVHPLTGADHVAAMLVVGLWSGLTLTQHRWLAPLAFALALLAGAIIAPTAAPAVEAAIAASLLVVGLLLAVRARLPLALAALLVATFAWAHGAAHGAELRGAAALAGMVAATLLLHAIGLAGGALMRDRDRWPAALAGGSVALLGAALLLQ